MRQEIVRINKVTSESFTGIKYDERTETYEVWVGTIKRYKKLSSAVKYLKGMIDYEDISKYIKVEDGLYELIEKKEKIQEVNINVSSELAAELVNILG